MYGIYTVGTTLYNVVCTEYIPWVTNDVSGQQQQQIAPNIARSNSQTHVVFSRTNKDVI